MSSFRPSFWVRYGHTPMSVTLVVGEDRVTLATPEDYIVSGDLVSLSPKMKQYVREWLDEKKTVVAELFYDVNYIYRSIIEG